MIWQDYKLFFLSIDNKPLELFYVKLFINVIIYPTLEEQNSKILPKAGRTRCKLIFLRASGDETTACHLEHKVWAAVADETASAMRYGFKGRS
jgi:hypothetical protein